MLLLVLVLALIPCNTFWVLLKRIARVWVQAHFLASYTTMTILQDKIRLASAWLKSEKNLVRLQDVHVALVGSMPPH